MPRLCHNSNAVVVGGGTAEGMDVDVLDNGAAAAAQLVMPPLQEVAGLFDDLDALRAHVAALVGQGQQRLNALAEAADEAVPEQEVPLVTVQRWWSPAEEDEGGEPDVASFLVRFLVLQRDGLLAENLQELVQRLDATNRLLGLVARGLLLKASDESLELYGRLARAYLRCHRAVQALQHLTGGVEEGNKLNALRVPSWAVLDEDGKPMALSGVSRCVFFVSATKCTAGGTSSKHSPWLQT